MTISVEYLRLSLSLYHSSKRIAQLAHNGVGYNQPFYVRIQFRISPMLNTWNNVINHGFLYAHKTTGRQNKYTQLSFFAVIMDFNLALLYIRLV